MVCGCSGGESGAGPADASPDVTVDAGQPKADVPTADIDFGLSDCGGVAAGPQTVTLKNLGTADLTWSASLDTPNFFSLIGPKSSDEPGAKPIPPGGSQVVTLGASVVPAATAAGASNLSKLTITTNDAARASTAINVKITARGGTLALTPQTAAFGLVPLATQATDIPLTLKNNGNDAVTVAFAPPSDPQFTLTWTGAPTPVAVAPGATVPGLVAKFKPSATSAASATAAITVRQGGVCGASISAIPLTGEGSIGVFAYQPQLIDFGQVACNTTSTLAAAQRTVTVTNNGTKDFTIASAKLTRGAASPYTVTLPSSLIVGKNGGTASIVVNPRAIPAASATTDNLYGDTLTILTDIAGDRPHPVALTQTALGAILAFQPATPIALGDVPITQTSTAPFSVFNLGNAPATVTAAASNGPVFSLDTTALGAIAAAGSAPVTATFAPTVTGAQTSLVSLGVAAGDVLCAPLPSLALGGTGTNGSLVISPSSLDFGLVNCGAQAAQRTVTVQNVGTAAFTLSPPQLRIGTSYTIVSPLTATTVAPGTSVVVTVRPNAVPAVSAVTPDLYADTLTLTTDIPADVPHDVPLHETARGAILTQSATATAFGGVPIATTATSQFTLSNTGNVSASVGVAAVSSVFSFNPTTTVVGPSAGSVVMTSFRPTTATAYTDTATLTLASGTPSCGAALAPIDLSGTGTNGVASVAPSSVDFGRTACGTQAAPQSISIQNNGTAAFSFTASVTAGGPFWTNAALGATSGTVDPGNVFNLAVTAPPVPATSQTTADLYAGRVTITTTAVGDTAHTVALHETAQGARLSLVTTPPGLTTLAFGSVAAGSSAFRSLTVRNDGNATANISWSGFTNPPYSASPDFAPVLGASALDVTATFAPVVSGSFPARLQVTTSDVLCLPLPAALTLSGSSP